MPTPPYGTPQGSPNPQPPAWGTPAAAPPWLERWLRPAGLLKLLAGVVLLLIATSRCTSGAGSEPEDFAACRMLTPDQLATVIGGEAEYQDTDQLEDDYCGWRLKETPFGDGARLWLSVSPLSGTTPGATSEDATWSAEAKALTWSDQEHSYRLRIFSFVAPDPGYEDRAFELAELIRHHEKA